MKHISYHDICIILDALSLYTKTMKELERANLTTSEEAMAQLHDNIVESIRLKEFFSKVGDQLAFIEKNLSVNIVAKFYND
jgi:esterase/lipase